MVLKVKLICASALTGRNAFPFSNLADFLIPLFPFVVAMFFLLTSDRPQLSGTMPIGNIRSNVNGPAEHTLNPFDSGWGLGSATGAARVPPWKSQQELNTSTQLLKDKARNRPRLAPACPLELARITQQVLLSDFAMSGERV
jgi:hypothetical protein